MIPRLAAVALTASVLAASSALAAPAASPFDAFQAVCLGPRADFAAVTAAADAGGWRPTEVTGDTTLAGVAVTSRLSRATKAGGVPLTLFAWSGANKAGVRVSACTMRIAEPAFDALAAQAAAFTGFAATDAAPKKAVYRFTDVPEGRRMVEKDGFEAAAAGPGMEILTVSGDVHGAVLDLLMIRK